MYGDAWGSGYDKHQKTKINQLTLKCTTPTPLVLNAYPDATAPQPDRQSLWLDLININDYAKFHQNISSSLPCQ